ncbi:ABC transporter substrate-binding protein [Paracoccus sp. (in: a-proteobacteria)]|uniref:ABC transporter substrate-binding protein n=1 Tax=Paracoccus sp. TaxID=267 RepID=UPI0026DFD013|nr:ABC transporter substrate-binding protein [Paracoccus sp. (in: a-proteobacteria)]MDO5647155.1 ABC transporter substrate-binding protein [Paracoccus sp. (in: a-proteobacteria)]
MFRILLPLLALTATQAAADPVTVHSCDRDVTVTTAPERAVVTGSNLTEIMLALGLHDQMLGYTGRGPDRDDDGMFPAFADLRQIQRERPSVEMLLEHNADFLFSGWNYGMRVGGEVTPESLARYGIAVYELSESCVHLGQQNAPSFDLLFRDLTNLAALFGHPDRASTLIAGYQARLDAVAETVAARGTDPLVFVYDSGDKAPLTAGGYAMPQAIIEATGARNLAADLEANWARIDWETVAERNPDVVLIVDYGDVSAEDKIAFMKNHPAFAHIGAVRDDRFLVLSYDAMTPGPRNIDAVERLTAFLAD